MLRAATLVVLIFAIGMFAVSASLHHIGVRNARQIANYHRLVSGNVLLDLSTGLPVQCTTDSDCQEKTGITY